ncbi:MAG: prepilin-type N-terminal cleavage/methylation domain-containing protein, partial [Planctomycetota bacterium]|nr:prepilin-type N-terminal cleavage/methylation domain-containing protein [Planctomycetota bacterium]
MAGSFHPPLPNTSTDSIRRARRGLTLIEMLIAVVLTLIVVFALVRVFQMLGDNVRDTKAILEMSGQLRTFLSQLQEDLDSRTVTVRSYADPEAAPGYFELIEGIATDRDVDGDGQIPLDGDGDNLLNSLLPVATFTQVDPMNRADADFHPVIDSQGNPVTDSQGNPRNAMTTKGDRDDVLMFTVRTSGKPFSGQLIGSLVFNSPQALNKWFYQHVPGGPRHTIESQEAEVVWWSEPDSRGNFHIYRRMLLVRPDIEITAAPIDPFRFVRDNDLSVRMVRTDPNDPSTAVLRANSLVDLTLRENRYAHLGQFGEGPNSFPFPLRLERLRYTNQLAKLLVDPILLANLLVDPSQRVDLLVDPNRLSEYLSLADTLAFDVKVFDPMAPLQF